MSSYKWPITCIYFTYLENKLGHSLYGNILMKICNIIKLGTLFKSILDYCKITKISISKFEPSLS